MSETDHAIDEDLKIDFEISEDELLEIVEDISSSRKNKFIEKANLLPKLFHGFSRASKIKKNHRDKLLARYAYGNEQKVGVLLRLWMKDNGAVVEQVAHEISEEQIREDVARLLTQGVDATKLLWALLLDGRKALQESLASGLRDELLQEDSVLRLRSTLQDTLAEKEVIQTQLNEALGTIDSLNKNLDAIRKEQKEKKAERKQLEQRNREIEEALATLEQEKKEVHEALRAERAKELKYLAKEQDYDELLSALRARIEACVRLLEAQEGLFPTPEGIVPSAGTLEDGLQWVIQQLTKSEDACGELAETLRQVSQERDALVPTPAYIERSWRTARSRFTEAVELALGRGLQTKEIPQPSKDWREWLDAERTLVMPLLGENRTSSEEGLLQIKRAQQLITLRWYLLEWIRLGMLEQLRGESYLLQHLNTEKKEANHD